MSCVSAAAAAAAAAFEEPFLGTATGSPPALEGANGVTVAAVDMLGAGVAPHVSAGQLVGGGRDEEAKGDAADAAAVAAVVSTGVTLPPSLVSVGVGTAGSELEFGFGQGVGSADGHYAG